MDPIIIERSWPGGSTLEVEPLRGTTFTEESGAHQFRISGVGTGTILAKFLRADDYTIDISGSIEDGAAVITLVGDCYHVAGRFSLVIYWSDGTDTIAIYAAVGNVYRATSGRELDSGTDVPTLQQLTAAYESAVSAAAAANTAAASLPEIATMAEFQNYVIEGGSGNE